VTGYLHALVEDAAREAGCTVAQMLGYQRNQGAKFARWRAMRRAHEDGYSLPQIGRAFNRDHTTVIYGLRKIAE
jgi:chromosomal replication initiation ATPase DnaA